MDINQVQETAHIFLVEDDESLASLVSDYFTLQGFKVTIEPRGDLATQAILAAEPDAVILDIMLPGKNGIEVCKELRAKSNIPVLMLTARTDEVDQIVGLEVGADDYICKPVKPRLLLARVSALLRRVAKIDQANANTKTPSHVLEFGQLSINKLKQEVTLAGELVDFTTSEFNLLYLFGSHANEVLSRDDLLNSLRGFGYDGLDRTVDMLVSKLRKKLGDNSAKPYKIKTVWRKGYLFMSDAWAESGQASE